MFNESNTVEAYVQDLLVGSLKAVSTSSVQEPPASYGPRPNGIGWHFITPADIPRQPHELLVEPWLRDALIRLNPEIAARPDLADEVLYKLRAIVLSVRSDGLIRANEEMAAWMRGERSMPFGPNNEHVPVRLIDFDDLARNDFVLTRQFTFRAGPAERRADLVLLVNGLPLVLIEAKTPVKKCISWVDGALQVHEDYEKFVPELFVCNVFLGGDRGQGVPLRLDRPAGQGLGAVEPGWRDGRCARPDASAEVAAAVGRKHAAAAGGARHPRQLHAVRHRQEEAPHQDHLPLPAIRGGQQDRRARAGGLQPKKGLIWHFQGSGKSLLMVFAAQKLRMHPGG
jgi:type I restriction enzyme R subunit